MSPDEKKKNGPESDKALKELWDSLTDEQKEKAKECKSTDELTALAGRMGIELPDEMLDSVAGGMIVRENDGQYTVYEEMSNRGIRFVGNAGSEDQAKEMAKKARAGTNIVDRDIFDSMNFKMC